MTKPYLIPISYFYKVEAEIMELEKLEAIHKLFWNYVSPLVILQNKDKKIIICIDHRELNDITVTDAEPNPSAAELITLMASSSIFSKFDMKKVFYQILLKPESILLHSRLFSDYLNVSTCYLDYKRTSDVR